MSGWILPRVMQPEKRLLSAIGGFAAGGGASLIGLLLRRATLALTSEEVLEVLRMVWVCMGPAACGATMGALFASASETFRGCTLTWSLPGAYRKVHRELWGCGVVATSIGAAIGALVSDGTWAMGATGAALAYGLAVVCTDPPAALRRVGLWGRLLGCVVPAYFMPEFAAAGTLSVGLALAAMWLLIARSGTGVLARSDGSGERRAAEAEAVLFAGADKIIWRGLRGPDGFVGVRRSNRDWVRAAVHAMWGSTMGGLVRNAWFQPVLMVMLLEVTSRVWGGNSANQGFGALMHSLLAGNTWESANSPVMNSGNKIPIGWAAMCLATLAGLKVSMSGIPFDAMPRRRRANVLWLRTQLEEWVWALVTAICFAAWAFVRSRLGDPTAWSFCATSLATMTLMMAVVPAFRLAMLQGYWWTKSHEVLLARSDYPIGSGAAVGGFGAVSMIAPAFVLSLINGEEAQGQAAVSGTVWLVLLGLILASRMGWYWALRRHSLRADLVAR